MLANCLFSRDPERPFDIEPDAFGRLESFWQAVGGSFLGGWLLGGWLVVENASKLSFF